MRDADPVRGAMALVELDPGGVQLVAPRRIEFLGERLERRARGRKQLPDRLARLARLDPYSTDELELERVAEQFPRVGVLPPGSRP
jgi:hypothetical protein